jgi:hypothetical protein
MQQPKHPWQKQIAVQGFFSILQRSNLQEELAKSG